MNPIGFAIRQPVTIVVGVILVVLFGLVSLQQIPVQLSPSVEEPVISVNTIWPGATPYEVERDIIEEQEKFLKGIPGLNRLESVASNNRGSVTLTFDIGTDLDAALLRVSNKLDEVPSYPENVDRPIIVASGATASPVMWVMLQTLPDNDRDITTYRTYLENDIRQYFDRVPGVSDLFIGGGVETEMHVVIDPRKLASHRLTIDSVVTALQLGNANISAGNLPTGRREVRVRTVAEYRSPQDIERVVLTSDGERRVTVADVATVEFGFERPQTPVISGGARAISIGVRPEPATNILDLTDNVELVINELNETILAEEGLRLLIVNEQRPYINGAINLLRQNIAIGGVFAICVLLLFLRKLVPTIVVSTAIPISIIGTFIFMYGFGSTLNVVSLAGIAFAVGMLVDNAIVVLENIDRHHSMGKSAFLSAYQGASEVWGAVLASSLTTIAVFLPVVFLQDEAGQLFRDIALAVTAAVTISLIVSTTVIPTLSNQLFRIADKRAKEGQNGKGFKIGLIGAFGSMISKAIMGILTVVMLHWTTRLATIVVLVSFAIGSAYTLMPKMEYLPQGNRDLIINVIIPPPALSYEERAEIGEYIRAFFEPHQEEKDGYPAIRHMFFVGNQASIIFGIVSADQARARELIPLCQEAIQGIPGVFGISNQASIFQTGLGQGRTVELNFSGSTIEGLVATAGAAFGQVRGRIEGVQVRPVPALDLLFPEANFVPSYDRLEAVNMSARQFGIGLDVLMDGRDIGDYKEEGQKKIDLVVKSATSQIGSPQDLRDALLVTPMGQTVTVGALAELVETTGLTEIRHFERDRTVTLQITPPTTITIQETMEILENEIIPSLREQNLMQGINYSMTGTADKLLETREALQWNFILAAGISYLLMAALLGNFIYPIIIMIVVPLAAAGGVIGLRLCDAFLAPQQLDILTMLGFIILIGIVVNNPILITYQALRNVREDAMEYKEAIMEAARMRIRPIYMSATTSILGMSPIVFFPGPGSELYRGLGSVILGGLALSTIFTLFLIPAMLMFVIQWETPGSAREADKEAAEMAAAGGIPAK